MLAPPKPPSHDDPGALIKEARERQLRRRLVGAAGVAIVAALGLSAYALAIGGGGHGRRAGGSASAGAPLCRASQLAASFGPGGAAGTDLGGLIVRNTAGTACSLPAGRPDVNVTFRGEPLRTVERSWPPAENFGRPARRLLAPGARAFLEIGWGDDCMTVTTTAPSSPDATLRVRFRDGLSMVVPETPPDRTAIVPGCNGVVTRPTPAIFVSRFLRL